MTRVTQQHVDARRGAILAAASRLFARKGTAGATMAEIANEADLSAGAIYRYFSSKEELLRAVFDDANERSQQLFGEAARGATSPLDALQRIGRYVWIEDADPDDSICDLEMVLSAARDPEDVGVDYLQTRKTVRGLLEDLVRQAQAAGELPADIDARQMAVILQACTTGIKALKLSPDDDMDVEGAFNLFVRMVDCLGTQTRGQQEG